MSAVSLVLGPSWLETFAPSPTPFPGDEVRGLSPTSYALVPITDGVVEPPVLGTIPGLLGRRRGDPLVCFAGDVEAATILGAAGTPPVLLLPDCGDPSALWEVATELRLLRQPLDPTLRQDRAALAGAVAVVVGLTPDEPLRPERRAALEALVAGAAAALTEEARVAAGGEPGEPWDARLTPAVESLLWCAGTGLVALAKALEMGRDQQEPPASTS